MALDGIFLYHLKNEIADFAIDSRVDKIHQPSKDEIVINLRSRQGSKKFCYPVMQIRHEFILQNFRETRQSRLCFACFYAKG